MSKMLTSVLIFTTLAAMQNPENTVQSKYRQILIDTKFRLTTKTFLEKHPECRESQIIERYIKQFVSNAVFYATRDGFPFEVTKTALEGAWDYTPTSRNLFDYIMTGEENCGFDLCMVHARAWKEELAKIEEAIAQK